MRDQDSETKRNGLTKRFAILGGVLVAAVCLAIGALSRQAVRSDLQSMAESNNVALTRAFANLVWPRYADFLIGAHRLGVEELRSDPNTLSLRRDVLAAMNDLSVLKVKIYDLQGLTVFSTDPTQIGDDKSGNAGYLAARSGKVASELTHRDTFSAFEQTIENRDVLSSYVPIRIGGDEVVGVFEIYYDVTSFLSRTQHSQLLQLGIVAAALAILYLLLILVVWRSEKRRQEQEEAKLRLARDAAVANESNRLKSEFMARMSHELRTPLNAILGFSEIVKGQIFGPVGSAKYLDYAKDIWASGRHLLAIVDDVLDMAKVEAGQFPLDETEFDLAGTLAAVSRLVERQARDAGVKLVVEQIDEPMSLWADERRVKQILLNLLSNAIKFTPSGGTVTLSAMRTQSGGLSVVVADTGAGIAKADISKVLTPFGRVEGRYSGDSGGAGLGLPIAKALSALHDAEFALDSEPERGTRITIEFPAERVREAETGQGGESGGGGDADVVRFRAC